MIVFLLHSDIDERDRSIDPFCGGSHRGGNETKGDLHGRFKRSSL